MTILEHVKMSLRVTTDAFDAQIQSLIDAAVIDLNIVGITGANAVTTNAFYLLAITTFVQLHFGAPEEFDKLSQAYDAMKGQLWSASDFTVWDRSA